MHIGEECGAGNLGAKSHGADLLQCSGVLDGERVAKGVNACKAAAVGRRHHSGLRHIGQSSDLSVSEGCGET